MCKAYYIFAALVVGVMIWDMRGVKEGNEGDIFFKKWDGCCKKWDGKCRGWYHHMKDTDKKRVKNICRAAYRVQNMPTPEADLMREDVVNTLKGVKN